MLYLVTATRTVQGGDTAEFVTVATAGGVAHPPGYPLFLVLASLCAAVVPGPMAFRVTVATILCAVGALFVLHRLVLRWTGDAVAAALASGGLGVSFLFWHWSTVAEVLPGGALTTALVLAAALGSARGATGGKQGLLVGLAAATGIANHHTVILLLPLCVFGWLAAVPRPRDLRGFAATTAGATLGVLAGFLPYGLLMGAEGAWVWGDTASLPGLLRHFLRADYGSFAIPHAGATGWWTHPAYYLRTVVTELGALAVLAPVGAAVGLGWRASHHGSDSGSAQWRERGLTAALLLSWLCAGPWLLSRFTYPTEGFFVAVVERFHLQPNVLVAALGGLGVAWLRRLPLWSRPAVPTALLAVSVALLGLLNLPRADWSSNTVLEDFLRNALESAEPNALLLTSGDAQTFGFVYAQEVLGIRPDVAAIAPGLLPHSWYRARLLARHPDLVLERDGRVLPWIGVAALNPQRTVLVSPRLAGQASEPLPLIPSMPFLAFVPPDAPIPGPAELEVGIRARLASFTLQSRVVSADECRHSLECTTWDHYALVLEALSSGYAAAGRPDDAARVHALATEFSPWLWE